MTRVTVGVVLVAAAVAGGVGIYLLRSIPNTNPTDIRNGPPNATLHLGAEYPHPSVPGAPIAASDSSARELLALFRKLLRVSPPDKILLDATRAAFLSKGLEATEALLSALLEDPACLKSELSFRKEVETVLRTLGTAEGVRAYLRAVLKFDAILSAIPPKEFVGSAAKRLLEILADVIGEKGTPDHVADIIALLGKATHPHVRSGLVNALGEIYKRGKDDRIRTFLVSVLCSDPDAEVRTEAARVLSIVRDPELLGDFLTRLSRLGALERTLNADEAYEVTKALINSVDARDVLALLETALRDNTNMLPAQSAGRALAEELQEGRLPQSVFDALLDRARSASARSDQVFYLSALQAIESKDPRIIETLREVEERCVDPKARTLAIFAIGVKGTAEDLLGSAKRGIETQQEPVVAAAAFAMNLYAFRHPEDDEIRKTVAQYAHSENSAVRLQFASNLVQLSPKTPNPFSELLKELSEKDPDPAVRRAAQNSLAMPK